ncbi:UNVERIFIED_CONTAM: hypothetical protein K2H54_061086 [Gekko kuhli]
MRKEGKSTFACPPSYAMDITIHQPWMRQPFGFPLLFPPLLFNQRLGEELPESNLFSGMNMLSPFYMQVLHILVPHILDTKLSEVKMDKDKFSVHLDVKQFSPEELNVKVVVNHVEVNAKHEEHLDEYGYISWEFHCCYMIPKWVDPASVTSALSPDKLECAIDKEKNKEP